MKTLHKFILIAGLEAILATGCTTSFLPNIIIQPSSSVSVSPSTTPSGTSASIIISQVNVNLSSTGNTTTPQPSSSPSASPSPGSGPSYVTTIFFDTAKSKDSISNHCSTSTSSTNQKSCSCQFSWGDLTSTNSTTSAISRKVQTPITSIQSNLVSCKAPSVWGSEIIDGTKISITVIPAPTNVDAGTFSVSVYSYTKNSKSTSGSFQDLANLNEVCKSFLKESTSLTQKIAPLIRLCMQHDFVWLYLTPLPLLKVIVLHLLLLTTLLSLIILISTSETANAETLTFLTLPMYAPESKRT